MSTSTVCAWYWRRQWGFKHSYLLCGFGKLDWMRMLLLDTLCNECTYVYKWDYYRCP